MPKKSVSIALDTPAQALPDVPEEEIEEIQPVDDPSDKPRVVTFALGDNEEFEDEGDGDDEEDGDEEDDEHDPDDLAGAVAQLTQLFMTEEGEAVTDVLLGVRDALEKQNKILYRGVQLLEKWAARR